jgi:hypothetical protein|tara:strand:- start:163 stop:1371 length:1209 start_codon:yes stop_codon:yes gene_type:complete
MKKYFYITVILLLTYSCNKDDDFINERPDIEFGKHLPNEMDNYSHFSNPVLYDNYLIVASSNYQDNKSTFFKLDRNGNFIDKWNVDNDHLLGNYLHHNEIYLYGNQLIYNSKYYGVNDEKIVSINLDNMETNWEISSTSHRSGLKGLGNKIYLNKYISNGNEIYELNLNNQNIDLIYQVSNGSYGLFTLPHEPSVYKIDNNNVGVLITSSNNDSYTLINYNITSQEVIWEVNLTEFNFYANNNEYPSEAAPAEVQISENNIVINSNSYISVRNLENGNLKWTKIRNVSYNVDTPNIGNGVITDSTDKLFCYDMDNGSIIWTREHKQDGVWVGKNEGKVIYNNYLFDKVPINILTGEAIWVKLDSWGELNIEFEGKPGIDKDTDELYYIGNNTRKTYKVITSE